MKVRVRVTYEAEAEVATMGELVAALRQECSDQSRGGQWIPTPTWTVPRHLVACSETAIPEPTERAP